MSSPILVAYHSSEGQTAKIATHIADELRRCDLAVDLVDIGDGPSPERYRGVVVGDSIHAGRHSRELVDYLTANAESLSNRAVALFQVSLTSATDDDEHTASALGMVHQLLERTGLDPEMVGLFAGALRYRQYGWLKRRMMSSIAKSEIGDHDTSQDHEYTDWDAVEAFARDAAGLFAEESN